MTWEVRHAICVECYDPTHGHSPEYNNPILIQAREDLRLDNARIHAIIAMEHIVSINKARLLLGYSKADDPPQRQAINELMAALCDAEINIKLKELQICLKDLFGP